MSLPTTPQKPTSVQPGGGTCMAIELAWIWLRYQPRSRLARWYAERFAKGGARMRRVGIVAVARRLMIDLWRFVEFGVLPEGAQLKA